MSPHPDFVLEEFLASWAFTRSMTHDFMDAVPDDQWHCTPHARYAPLCQQFRHMVWVTGLYRETLQTRDMKACATKHTHYGGDLTREAIGHALRAQTEQLAAVVQGLRGTEVASYRVKAFGTVMGFSEFSHVILQHESNHHGMWSLYAAHAGFASPASWRDNWGM